MNKSNLRVSVIGLGYIGLPTAAIIANKGIIVNGFDINKDIVDTINSGKIHIVEEGLESVVSKVIKEEKFKADTKLEQSDVFLIAVPTPFKKNNSLIPEPDISFVNKAVEQISNVIKKGDLIILESTSPVGTTENIFKMIIEKSKLKKEDFFLAYCPERVLPGNILWELENNSRIVGGINKPSSNAAKDFYSLFCLGEISTTDSNTAELVKLAENSYRDVNLAFSNELSMICNELDINVYRLINLANKHPRVGILSPGCGVGGHCLAVDPWFIASSFPDKSKLIKSARQVNDYKKVWAIDEIMKEVSEFILKKGKKPTIGCCGISYKPNIDDLRESPAKFIVKSLLNKKQNVIVCEPNINHVEGIKLTSLDKIIQAADIIVFLVGHKEFTELELKNKTIVDLCGILNTN